MVAAEARASGVPLIVPDRGAAADQLVRGAGAVYRSASERSLERAIERFIARGPELQRAAAVRSSSVRTMDEHFAELFSRYGADRAGAGLPAVDAGDRAAGGARDGACRPTLTLPRNWQ